MPNPNSFEGEDVIDEELLEPNQFDVATEKIKRQQEIRFSIENKFPQLDFVNLAKEDLEDNEDPIEVNKRAAAYMKEYALAQARLINALEKKQVSLQDAEDMLNSAVGAATCYAANIEVNHYYRKPDGEKVYASRRPYAGELAAKIMSQAAVELESLASVAQANAYSVYIGKLIHSATQRNVTDSELGDFLHVSQEINGMNRSPKPEMASDSEYENSLSALSEYAESFFKVSGSALSVEDAQHVNGYAMRLATIDRHPNRLRAISCLLNELDGIPATAANKQIFMAAAVFGRQHPLNDDQASILSRTLLPALEAHSENSLVLEIEGNKWGMKEGDYGIGDFTVAAFASTYSPAEINRLQMALKQMPTSDLYRFEQNRKDALLLSHTFGNLRDLIHDQRPGVHELLTKMLAFYDDGNGVRLKQFLASSDSEYFINGSLEELVVVRSLYDGTVTSRDGKNIELPIIDIVRRLQENTKPASETMPLIEGQSGEMLKDISSAFLNKDIANLGNALSGYVDSLEEKIIARQEGVMPDTAKSIAWLGRICFKQLQEITYEDQLSLGKQVWFQSILKLQELTASNFPYSKESFAAYLEEVQTAKTNQELGSLLMRRTLQRITGLAEQYEQEGRNDWKDSLWSGNIDHELMSLVDARPAQTAYGERHRKESLIPVDMRRTGD